MFERFSPSLRRVVGSSPEYAAETGGERIGEEELALALLADQEGTAARVLRDLGVGTAERAEIARRMAERRRHGGFTDADADALATLGIDIHEVVARVEAAHGEGSLTARRPGGASARTAVRTRHRMTPGAKQVLERALRDAVDRRERVIGTEHLLLSMVSLPGTAADALAGFGVTRETVWRQLAATAQGT
ncbi:Clp protease N-terminal domain-containing protein [Yinghuangia sp. YIM S09857]|uniref:Clp protease N-terminal domain-containing protein n=1 Tax=Yinghuangia sp. YIM S09857 TaxID=3436929 RepID=UPI003F5315B1